MLIGYARVSRDEQNHTAQVAELTKAGCVKVVQEKASGGRWDRPELQDLLKYLREGDTLVVWKLDRLSRSLKDLLAIMETLNKSKVGFRSLTENIDTTTAAGRMQMVGVFAEFERSMIRERTKAGLDAARREGRRGGRKFKFNALESAEIVRLVTRGEKTAASIAPEYKVNPVTIHRLMERHKVVGASA
jgi:DNA invertase Pin-like site-specific DNA recombinase